jgi:hypothetical protein
MPCGTLRTSPLSEPAKARLRDYIANFVEQSGALKVHIMRIARETVESSQLCLAAADIDADVFRGRCPAIVRLALRTTPRRSCGCIVMAV